MLEKPAKRGPKPRKWIQSRTPIQRSSAPIKRTVRPKAKRSTPAARLWAKADDRARQLVRRRDPMCRFCGVARTTDTAHLFPRGRYGTRCRMENLAGSCRPCHDRLDRRMTRDERTLAIQRLVGFFTWRRLQRLAGETAGARTAEAARLALADLDSYERYLDTPRVPDVFSGLSA
jgi:5-methylcytosine-specific restriction endonuclease McrA